MKVTPVCGDSSACRCSWVLTVIDSPVVILPKTAQLSVPLPPVITATFSVCDSGQEGPGSYFTYKCTFTPCNKKDN